MIASSDLPSAAAIVRIDCRRRCFRWKMRRWSGVRSFSITALTARQDPPCVHRLVRRDLVSRQLARLLGIDRLRAQAAAAKAPVHRVAGDSEDPDQQRRGALKARKRVEDGEEDLLGHVLGLRRRRAGAAARSDTRAESRFRRAARSPAGSRPGCWRPARRRSARPSRRIGHTLSCGCVAGRTTGGFCSWRPASRRAPARPLPSRAGMDCGPIDGWRHLPVGAARQLPGSFSSRRGLALRKSGSRSR